MHGHMYTRKKQTSEDMMNNKNKLTIKYKDNEHTNKTINERTNKQTTAHTARAKINE